MTVFRDNLAIKIFRKRIFQKVCRFGWERDGQGMNLLFSEEEKLRVDDEPEKKRKICFVCTGNTCRSPMAAAVLNALGADKGYVAVSAGLFPSAGSRISLHAVSALKKAGFVSEGGNDYEKHVAVPMDEAMMQSCDRVIGITSGHVMQLMMNYPAYASKIEGMPEDVVDPYGGRLQDYELCLQKITEGIKKLFAL